MMFRDKSISKFYAYALAAVFALTLAGCGGSSSKSMDDDPGTTPDADDGRRKNATAAERPRRTDARTAADYCSGWQAWLPTQLSSRATMLRRNGYGHGG